MYLIFCFYILYRYSDDIYKSLLDLYRYLSIEGLTIQKLFKGLYRRCECGCGYLILIIDKYYKFRRYKIGHYNRGRMPSGEKAPHYKGGIKMNGKYKMLLSPNHPFKDKQGYVREHRLIYEHYLKILFDEDIYIPREYDIHHIIPIDKGGTNALINLTCVSRPEHTKIHNPFIDRTGFKCIITDCKKPYETYTTKDGYPHWYEYKDGWICSRCYDRIIRVVDHKAIYRKDKEKYRKKSLEYYFKNREKYLEKMKERYWNKKRNKNNQDSLDTYI